MSACAGLAEAARHPATPPSADWLGPLGRRLGRLGRRLGRQLGR